MSAKKEAPLPMTYVDVKRITDYSLLAANTMRVKAVGIVLTGERPFEGFVARVNTDTTHTRNKDYADLPFILTPILPFVLAQEQAKEFIYEMVGPHAYELPKEIINIDIDATGKEKFKDFKYISDSKEEQLNREMEWIKKKCVMIPIAFLMLLHQTKFK